VYIDDNMMMATRAVVICLIKSQKQELEGEGCQIRNTFSDLFAGYATRDKLANPKSKNN